MTELFVSYSRDDTAVIEPIVENLRQLGFDLWIDIEYLDPGTPAWMQAIDDALQRCDGVVAFLSPTAKESTWCNIETSRAQTYYKPIYPVMLSGDVQTSVPIHLHLVQFADMRGRANYKQQFKQLVKKLENDLKHDVSGHVEGSVYPLKTTEWAQPAAPVTPESNIGSDPTNPTDMIEVRLDVVDILDILPTPFEWCEIPAGRVVITGHSFDVQPIFMAKYQTTYEQFQVFIDAADGFHNDEWWQGLAERQSEPGSQYFTHDWNLPRENVSWYDAVAFCRWLSSKVGYEVRLPTEWEWQWAAQGGDGRAYPWGNVYIKGFANIDEKNSGIDGGAYLEKTTPVGRYPKGASPYGVMDMSGNVLEWCLNEYDNPGQVETTGDARRVVRGGSWNLNNIFARVVSRVRYYPRYRGYDLGFRVVGFVPALQSD